MDVATVPVHNTVPLFEARGVTIRFGDLVANHQVDIALHAGEIHCVLGENGAGKSTILKALYGVYHPQAGSFFHKGEPIRIQSPAEARAVGLGMVFQDLRLVPAFTVLENIALATDQGFSPDLRALRQTVANVASLYNLTVDPDAYVWQLDVAGRQRAEIVKVLMTGAKVLLLDEPTSVLALSEVDSFLAMLRRLADEGHAVVMVTHKMREVLACADRVTVMRGGRVVSSTNDVEGLDEDALIRLMVGEWAPPPPAQRSAPSTTETPALHLHDVSVVDDRGRTILANVGLTVKPGEVMGVAGISGNGQRELSEVLIGIRPCAGGTVTVQGATLTGASPDAFLHAGIASIPQSPGEEGVVSGLTVLEHLAYDGLPRRQRHGQVDWATLREDFDAIPAMASLNVPAPTRRADQLSGGNIQRMAAARVFARRPKVVVACYPTQGLDIASTRRLIGLLLELREAGVAVLYFSEDLSELYEVSDQLLVVTHGHVLGPFDPATVPAYEIAGMMVAGAQRQVVTVD